MLPTREEAEELLAEAEKCNPGPWGKHSRVAAQCAEQIAQECEDLEGEKAYILGLLHDIGRKCGVRHLGHVSDGYSYMMSLGYDEAAQICLTHSFHDQTTDGYVGRFDTSEEELKMIQEALKRTVISEYDSLIQLCDALAGAEGVMDIEERLYGSGTSLLDRAGQSRLSYMNIQMRKREELRKCLEINEDGSRINM